MPPVVTGMTFSAAGGDKIGAKTCGSGPDGKKLVVPFGKKNALGIGEADGAAEGIRRVGHLGQHLVAGSGCQDGYNDDGYNKQGSSFHAAKQRGI